MVRPSAVTRHFICTWASAFNAFHLNETMDFTGKMTKQDALKKYFGYETFYPLQAEIIDHALAGKNALVLMPTGGGKSVCFQIPALMKEGTAIVISPLIALMKDQVDSLTANGIPAAFLNSALTEEESAAIRR